MGGLSKKYKNNKAKEKRPMETRYGILIGTCMYASVGDDNGLEQAPKDDMESLGYIFFYLLGELPWMDCPKSMTTEEFIAMISYEKRHMTPEEYSETASTEFATFLKDMKHLKYKDRPPYDKMKSILRKLAKNLNIQYNDGYDWILKKKKKLKNR